MVRIFTDLEESVEDDVALRLSAYLAGFSDLSAVPLLLVQPRIGLSPREAFVLSLVDGKLSMAEILEATPMRHRDTLMLLCAFAEKGYVRERTSEDALPEGARFAAHR